MAVRIRLARRGRKKLAMYDIIVADSRSPRDGKFIEKLGSYNPNTHPATILLNSDRAFKWLMDGALPTDTTRGILSQKGLLLKKHLQIGVNKGAITQEEADSKLNSWIEAKEKGVISKVEALNKKKAEEQKKRLEAEALVNKTREEAIRRKNTPPVEEVAVEGTVAVEGATDDPTEPTAEAAQETEAKAEGTPAAE